MLEKSTLNRFFHKLSIRTVFLSKSLSKIHPFIFNLLRKGKRQHA